MMTKRLILISLLILPLRSNVAVAMQMQQQHVQRQNHQPAKKPAVHTAESDDHHGCDCAHHTAQTQQPQETGTITQDAAKNEITTDSTTTSHRCTLVHDSCKWCGCDGCNEPCPFCPSTLKCTSCKKSFTAQEAAMEAQIYDLLKEIPRLSYDEAKMMIQEQINGGSDQIKKLLLAIPTLRYTEARAIVREGIAHTFIDLMRHVPHLRYHEAICMIKDRRSYKHINLYSQVFALLKNDPNLAYDEAKKMVEQQIAAEKERNIASLRQEIPRLTYDEAKMIIEDQDNQTRSEILRELLLLAPSLSYSEAKKMAYHEQQTTREVINLIKEVPTLSHEEAIKIARMGIATQFIYTLQSINVEHNEAIRLARTGCPYSIINLVQQVPNMSLEEAENIAREGWDVRPFIGLMQSVPTLSHEEALKIAREGWRIVDKFVQVMRETPTLKHEEAKKIARDRLTAEDRKEALETMGGGVVFIVAYLGYMSHLMATAPVGPAATAGMVASTATSASAPTALVNIAAASAPLITGVSLTTIGTIIAVPIAISGLAALALCAKKRVKRAYFTNNGAPL